MKKIISDWRDFCEKKLVVDKLYFFTMFQNDFELDDLSQIFGVFDCRKELEKRMETVKNSFFKELNNFEKKDRLSKLIHFVELDLLERRKICSIVGEKELSEILRGLKPRYVEEQSLFNELEAASEIDSWLFEVAGDYVGTLQRDDDFRVLALEEAFYGFDNDYYLSWYLGQPFFQSPICFDYYFSVWNIQGKYAVTESELIFTFR